MKNEIGNYKQHAQYWDWANLDHDRTPDDEYWYNYAKQYGNNILIPMCAWGAAGPYMAQRGMTVTGFDITPEMIAEGKKHHGDIGNLSLYEGDIRDFRFDIAPIDFCFCYDLGHIHSIEEIKLAFACINNHLRDGGCLVVETGIIDYNNESIEGELQTFRTKENPYPDRTVYKTGIGRNELETGRFYISQTMYIEYNDGRKEQFDHEFYMQGYTREEWLNALKECGFEIKGEYKNREKEPWSEGDGYIIFEAVKCPRGGKLRISEILYQLTDFTDLNNSAGSDNTRIEWLTENDSAKFNEHLVLAGQNPGDDKWFRGMYRNGTARYCLLYYNELPVARGAIEPYSEQSWEAADIRTAKDYRCKGFAKEILRFLSQSIIVEHGRIATCRTEKHNIAMQKVMNYIGYKELGR